MIYKVRAKYIPEKAGEFFERLTDGTIENQKPDGAEIVASMKRAKITESGAIEWFETCYCDTPLAHERATVLDHFFADIATDEVGDYGEVEGESFWEYLKNL